MVGWETVSHCIIILSDIWSDKADMGLNLFFVDNAKLDGCHILLF